ncbi:MXAN_6230/SCO0854 family RING domain-containing protein [Embleya sp. NPDC008237]|uniref:MXAN_6230/SCO0854 family RING domain-containing protein n=1 Tax=Embleya sp. NPDC008237 TaxID=3363978 RepID=UPI0036EC215D
MSGGVRSVVRVDTSTAADDLDGLLVRRLASVYVDAKRVVRPDRVGVNTRGIAALEADLVQRGHVLTAPLRTALAGLRPVDLATHGMRLLARLDARLGNDRRHRPLFAGFPAQVPNYAQARYSTRIRAFLLNQPNQPCAICGRAGDIGALAPCAHLLCSTCAPVEELRACPVCAEPIRLRKPHLTPAGNRTADMLVPLTGTLAPLRLGVDREADALGELLALLARRTPLGPQDRHDLILLAAHAPTDAERWLPTEIPVRESKAVVLAGLLPDHLPAGRLDTATDVLRVLWAWSGAHPDLLTPPRLRTVPRRLRRTLLAVLDGLPPEHVYEDLHRHRQAWLRAGELLHPFDYIGAYPTAALAFAALRGTDPQAHRAGPALLLAAEAHGDAVTVVADRIVVRTFASRVETLLAAGDTAGATELLVRRPGELVRRLHHLLRVRGGSGETSLPAELDAALPGVLRRVGPGPLLGAWGRLRAERTAGERRVWFPRGSVAGAYARNDPGAPVPIALSAPVCVLIERELTRRALELPRHEVALLDAGLDDLIAPFAEHSTAKALVAIPRGSTQPMPRGGRIRLFLHWMQAADQRVDLDLSIALYDANWEYLGLCDYTNLVYGPDRAMVHSGDFTSAPAPHGATEFVDLDIARLAAQDVRYAVVVVFSYNDVAFDDLLDAFAGFQDLDAVAAGRTFDPSAVRQRFDLAGDARICVPMTVDLAAGTAQWTDLNLSGQDGLHNVFRHTDRLAELARDLRIHFAPGGRATLGDLARIIAAATTDRVLIRGRRAGEVTEYRRAADEDADAFAARLRDGVGGIAAHLDAGEELVAGRAFVALVHGDIPITGGGTLYRLYPGPADTAPAEMRRWSAPDLASALGPTE